MSLVMKFKVIIISILVIIAIGLNIYKVNEVYGGNKTNNYKSEIISLSESKYKNTLKNYERKIDYCIKEGKSNK